MSELINQSTDDTESETDSQSRDARIKADAANANIDERYIRQAYDRADLDMHYQSLPLEDDRSLAEKSTAGYLRSLPRRIGRFLTGSRTDIVHSATVDRVNFDADDHAKSVSLECTVNQRNNTARFGFDIPTDRPRRESDEFVRLLRTVGVNPDAPSDLQGEDIPITEQMVYPWKTTESSYAEYALDLRSATPIGRLLYYRRRLGRRYGLLKSYHPVGISDFNINDLTGYDLPSKRGWLVQILLTTLLLELLSPMGVPTPVAVPLLVWWLCAVTAYCFALTNDFINSVGSALSDD